MASLKFRCMHAPVIYTHNQTMIADATLLAAVIPEICGIFITENIVAYLNLYHEYYPTKG